MLIKRNMFYRIVVISICFLLLAIMLFIPLASYIDTNPVLFYSVLGVFLFVYVAFIVANELVIHFKYSPKEQGNGGEDR